MEDYNDYFTSICTNYAHKARTLAESVKKNIPDAKFLVCLTEREVPKSMECPYFDEVILSKDMWEGNFNRYIYKHAIVEASTSVKGHFSNILLNIIQMKINLFIWIRIVSFIQIL